MIWRCGLGLDIGRRRRNSTWRFDNRFRVSGGDDFTSGSALQRIKVTCRAEVIPSSFLLCLAQYCAATHEAQGLGCVLTAAMAEQRFVGISESASANEATVNREACGTHSRDGAAGW
jgi:hypothetical protein